MGEVKVFLTFCVICGIIAHGIFFADLMDDIEQEYNYWIHIFMSPLMNVFTGPVALLVHIFTIRWWKTGFRLF
jgi:hypothetical protein